MVMLPSLNSSTSSSEVPRVLLGHEGHVDADVEEELLMASGARERHSCCCFFSLSLPLEQKKDVERRGLKKKKKTKKGKNQRDPHAPCVSFSFLRRTYCYMLSEKGDGVTKYCN